MLGGDEMNCDEVRNLIFSYIDNEADEDEKLLIEEHIENCDECKKELEEYRKIIKALNDLPDEEPPAGYCKRLHEKLLNSKVTVFKDESVIGSNTPKRRKSKYGWVKYASLAAAVVLVFTVAIRYEIYRKQHCIRQCRAFGTSGRAESGIPGRA